MRHEKVGACPRCEKMLEQAHPYFSVLWKTLKSEFPTVHISTTFRSEKDQEVAFQQGRSRLHWDASDHNRMDSSGKECSRAIDLFEINKDGVAIWSHSQFFKIAEWLERNDYPVGSGIRWTKFKDGPHFFLLPFVSQP